MCFRPTAAGVVDAPLICTQCGSENAPGETKCLFCGANLPASDSADVSSPSAPPTPNAQAPSVPGPPAPPKNDAS